MTVSKILFKSTLVLLGLLLASNSLAQQYSKVTYVHSEADGTAFAATDSQGNIEWQIDHYPYGGEYSNTEVARKSDISFAGKPFDAEIGLSYFGARWYDPDIGRFTGIDPMPVNPNDYRTFNRYSYAFNNPYKYQDPDGRLPVLIPFAIFLAKEVAAEGASRATGGATDFLSVRRMGTKVLKKGAKALKNNGNKLSRTNGCCCFDKGTLVKTDVGFSPIESIKVGDLVYSYNEETKQTLLKPVSELFITDPKPLYELSLTDSAGKAETFVVTDNHPYWVIDKGWVDSAKLESGMLVKSLNGAPLKVSGLVKQDQIKPTYNFTVADTHTYFVGVSEALVHNCNCGVRGGVDDLVKVAGGKARSSGDIVVEGGSKKAKDLFRQFDAKGSGNRGFQKDKTGGGRQVIGETYTGDTLRLRFKPDGTTRIQAGKQKFIFPKAKAKK